MNGKNKGNPVSNQSKLWMENALLKLMETENYKEITIQEITDNAGLSRRTFYRNYSSKDEILAGCFYRIWMEYRLCIEEQTNLALPNIARIFFTVINKHFDFLFLINRQNLLHCFFRRLMNFCHQTLMNLKGRTCLFQKKIFSML